jgi:hypothetical protein
LYGPGRKWKENPRPDRHKKKPAEQGKEEFGRLCKQFTEAKRAGETPSVQLYQLNAQVRPSVRGK